jgi:hypothetical protein
MKRAVEAVVLSFYAIVIGVSIVASALVSRKGARRE